MIDNRLTDKRARLHKVAQDYQSTLSWYHENLDNLNAERDCDEAAAAFKREIYSQEIDIIADLLDEIDELQERSKNAIDSEPVAYQYCTFDPGHDEWTEWEDCGESTFEQLSAEAQIPDSGIQIRKLYTSPQPELTAPEIVPEALRDEIIDLCAGYEIGDQGAQEIWEACRAVMLSGDKP